MQTFILAGGFATRLWPLTEKRAKPLLPLAGRPIVEHLITALPTEFPVTISTNAAFAQGFQSWIAQLQRPVSLVVEESKSDRQKTGALGALAEWITKEQITEDILLLTGDNYLGFSMKDFLSAYRTGIPLLAAHDLKNLSKASLFGTVITDPADAALVKGFEEKPINPQTTLVSTGCSVIPKETIPVLLQFAASHPDNIGGIFEEFLRKGIPVRCFTFTEPWLDIGSFDSYLAAHRLLVGEKTLVADGSHVIDSVCQGSVAIGKGSRIEKSEISDCIIFDDCEITDCNLSDCVIDNHCRLTGVDLTGKMLREGTVLRLT